MSYDPIQFRELIEDTLDETALEGIRLKWASDAAVRLLLGTAAVESDFGTYLRQRGAGGALGAFQIELPTFNDLKARFGDRFSLVHYTHDQCRSNLWLAILMARLKYWSIPSPLPAPQDIYSLASYWKLYYNTELGAGRTQDFVDKFRLYVEWR